MLRYLVDIAIEDQVDEVRVIPSKMVLRSGNPRSVDLIQRRYDRTPEELGFVYDEDLSRHRFSINGKVNLGDDSTADCASLSLLDIMLGKIFWL